MIVNQQVQVSHYGEYANLKKFHLGVKKDCEGNPLGTQVEYDNNFTFLFHQST